MRNSTTRIGTALALLAAFALMGCKAHVRDLSPAPATGQYRPLSAYTLVAGITEEIGFRGYMQVGLERRYGPPEESYWQPAPPAPPRKHYFRQF